jgi:CubicO group peptidase (beta-lactamase class C family)
MQISKSLSRILLVLTLATGFFAGSLHEQRAETVLVPDEDADIGKIVDSALRPVVTQAGFTGIVIGVRRDGRDFFYFRGDRKSKGNNTPPDPKTLFMIGSITKTFTATQLALYAQQGLVTLDQPFQKNIPGLYQAPPGSFKSKITLEQLATHSAGLKRNSCAKAKVGTPATTQHPPYYLLGPLEEEEEFDPKIPGCVSMVPPFIQNPYQETEAYEEYRCENGYKGCQLVSQPGTKHTYSNFAFGLLGLSLAKAASPAHSSWDYLLRRDITAPLLMSDTGIRGQLTGQQLLRRATGHARNGSAVPDNNPEVPTFPTLAAGGALWSTPEDLMRWMTYSMSEYQTPLQSLLTTVLKKRHTFEGTGNLINQPGQKDSMALAWEYTPLNAGAVKGQSSPSEVVWKGGGSPGFNSYVGFIRKKGNGTGVFIMANFLFAKNYRVSDLGLSILRALEKE